MVETSVIFLRSGTKRFLKTSQSGFLYLNTSSRMGVTPLVGYFRQDWCSKASVVVGWQGFALNVDKVSIMPGTFCKIWWARSSSFSHSSVPSLFIRCGQFLCVVLMRQLVAWHSCLLHLDALFSSTLQVVPNLSPAKITALALYLYSWLLWLSQEGPSHITCGGGIPKVKSDKLCVLDTWKWKKHKGFSSWISSPLCSCSS